MWVVKTKYMTPFPLAIFPHPPFPLATEHIKDLTLGGEHHVIHRWFIVELYIWNVYDFIKLCHPNPFNKKY